MPTDEKPDPAPADFWSARCGRFAKELLLFGLVSSFIIQTCLVYSDRYDTSPLEPLGSPRPAE